jgi:ABC-type dipeptide/oligopeptide/nickel transport system permease subunit
MSAAVNANRRPSPLLGGPQLPQWRGVLQRLLKNGRATFAAVVLAICVLGSAGASLLTPYAPEQQFASIGLSRPSLAHPFGTDDLGRDVLSRVLFGGRASLLVGALSMAVALVLGVPLGLYSGYYRGWLDQLAMRLLDALLALPSLVLALFIVAILGPSLLNAILAIGVTYIPHFARIIRAEVLALREREFVEAARCLGASDGRVLWRQILPNCLTPLLVQVSLGAGSAILVEASLSFLGLGVQPPTPSWGGMLSQARQMLTVGPWISIFPGLAILLSVLCLNYLGDGLREALDPRLRRLSS